MAEKLKIPHIVRERLMAATSAGSHPDADVLTAFAEKSLTAHEGSLVLDHVARCSECRDVLALALPETQVQTLEVRTPVVPSREGWITWPALRWGFIAAGVIAIASLGVVQYERNTSHPSMVVKETANPEAGATVTAQGQPSGVSEAGATKADNKVSALPKLAANAGAKKVAQPESDMGFRQFQASTQSIGGSVAAAPLTFGPAQSPGSHQPAREQQAGQQLQRQEAALASGSSPGQTPITGRNVVENSKPAPSASESVAVEVTSAAVPLETSSASAQDQFHSSDYSLSKAKPAVAQAAPAPFAAVNRKTAAPMDSGSSADPEWTISVSGTLQRSFDRGQSWQDVDVNAADASSLKSMAAPAADAPVAKEKSVQAGRSAPGALTFRAVAANGADVWAGASGGALYHSADAGGHWSRAIPAAGGITATGDIVAVDFPDTQHGRIMTSTSEVWATSDGGQNWQKQ